MTADDEKALRVRLCEIWTAVGEDREELIDLIVAHVRKMQNDEAELWKDRCEAERQAHEATIKHAEEEAQRDW